MVSPTSAACAARERWSNGATIEPSPPAAAVLSTYQMRCDRLGWRVGAHEVDGVLVDATVREVGDGTVALVSETVADLVVQDLGGHGELALSRIRWLQGGCRQAIGAKSAMRPIAARTKSACLR